LDEQFNPILHVASVAVIVEPPYREPSFRIAEPIFREVELGFDVIVHEAELYRSLLDKMKADVVHFGYVAGRSFSRGDVPCRAHEPSSIK
jgi:hypothetical protein